MNKPAPCRSCSLMVSSTSITACHLPFMRSSWPQARTPLTLMLISNKAHTVFGNCDKGFVQMAILPRARYTNMSEEKNLPKWIAVAASITTLSVPFMYIFGYAYDQGYLHAYGVSNEFFARSIQEYLVFSFIACLEIAASIHDFFMHNQRVFISFALILGCIALAIVFAGKHQFGERLRGKAAPLKEHRLFDYFLFPFISASFAYVLPYALISTMLIILLIPAIAYYKGQNVAEKEIANAKRCAYTNVPIEDCVFLLDNGKPIASGKLVARSSTHMALFNQGKTSIYPVKDQVVEVAPASKNPDTSAKRDTPSAAPATP